MVEVRLGLLPWAASHFVLYNTHKSLYLNPPAFRPWPACLELRNRESLFFFFDWMIIRVNFSGRDSRSGSVILHPPCTLQRDISPH